MRSPTRRALAGLGLACILLTPASSQAILDGHLAETCAFPSLVRLDTTRSNSSCSASYIGGRVLVTAAHCLDGKGYYLDHEIFRGRAGANVYQCSEDEDCPTVMIAGSPRPLLCEGQPQDWNESPAGTGECYLPELEYNNDALDAYFGESYDPYGLDHPANIIPIRYCHINPGYIVDPDDESQDFAYCILAEAPDVRPIPIMMHCEVDQFMNGDADLDVMIAGFGVGDVNENTPDGKAGRKRWATSSTDGFAFDSADTVLSLAPFAPFVPGPASGGDSGGPVYVRLPPPHDSWRLFGVFGKSYFVAPPWRFVAWMLEDPEVEAEAILPCHDVGGDWQPGPACGGFPRSPQIGAGGWSNGPLACNNEDLSEQSSTCGPPFPSPLPPPPPRDPVITRPLTKDFHHAIRRMAPDDPDPHELRPPAAKR